MRNVFLAPLSPEKNNLKKYKYFVCPIPVFLWTIRQLSQYDKNSVILKITNDKVLLFSFLVMSNSLQSHELQHSRLPCPSPSPWACSNSCPLSQWCHLILCGPLLLLPPSFPASGSFLIGRLFTSGGQSVGTTASVLLMNIQDWFPLGLTNLISL